MAQDAQAGPTWVQGDDHHTEAGWQRAVSMQNPQVRGGEASQQVADGRQRSVSNGGARRTSSSRTPARLREDRFDVDAPAWAQLSLDESMQAVVPSGGDQSSALATGSASSGPVPLPLPQEGAITRGSASILKCRMCSDAASPFDAHDSRACCSTW